MALRRSGHPPCLVASQDVLCRAAVSFLSTMALSSGGRFTQRAVFVYDTIALARIAQSRGFFDSCGVPRGWCSLVAPFWRWGILQRVWGCGGLECEGSFGMIPWFGIRRLFVVATSLLRVHHFTSGSKQQCLCMRRKA